jgi:hypothetical protein
MILKNVITSLADSARHCRCFLSRRHFLNRAYEVLAELCVKREQTYANNKCCEGTEERPRKPCPFRTPLEPICGKLIRVQNCMVILQLNQPMPRGIGKPIARGRDRAQTVIAIMLVPIVSQAISAARNSTPRIISTSLANSLYATLLGVRITRLQGRLVARADVLRAQPSRNPTLKWPQPRR